mgnify:CR=1 FL=1
MIREGTFNFGFWVYNTLAKTDVSCAAFADKAGFDKSIVYVWKKTSVDPRLASVVMACEVLSTITGTDMDDLIIDALQHTHAYQTAKVRLGTGEGVE